MMRKDYLVAYIYALGLKKGYATRDGSLVYVERDTTPFFESEFDLQFYHFALASTLCSLIMYDADDK